MNEQSKFESFVLFSDWIELFEDLTNEEIGILFKAVFLFVNGENDDTIKEIIDDNKGVKIAYKAISRQIKANFKKYSQIVEVRKNAASKRWNSKKDMQNDANDANASFAYAKNANAQFADAKSTEKNFAYPLHSDNVPVNVPVNDIVPENGNEIVNVDFSAVELSAEQLASLVSFSSRPVVEIFISKAREWQIKNKRKYKDPFKTIKGWIEEDQKKNKPKNEITIEELAGNHLIPL